MERLVEAGDQPAALEPEERDLGDAPQRSSTTATTSPPAPAAGHLPVPESRGRGTRWWGRGGLDQHQELTRGPGSSGAGVGLGDVRGRASRRPATAVVTHRGQTLPPAPAAAPPVPESRGRGTECGGDHQQDLPRGPGNSGAEGGLGDAPPRLPPGDLPPPRPGPPTRPRSDAPGPRESRRSNRMVGEEGRDHHHDLVRGPLRPPSPEKNAPRAEEMAERCNGRPLQLRSRRRHRRCTPPNPRRSAPLTARTSHPPS